MNKKFIINLFFLLFLNVLIKPFWIFGVERKVQNLVGAEEFGFYFSLLSFSFLINIILDFGITNFNNRNISQNHNILSKHFSNIVTLRFLLAIIYAVFSLSIALTIGYDLRQLQMLGILIFNQFLASFILYLRSNISGLQLFKTDSLISILDRFLMISICSILIWGNITKTAFRIEWFVLSQTFSYLLTAIIAFIIVFRKTTFFRLNFNKNFFLVFLRRSYPYALLTLLMSFYNRIDSVMIERLLNNGKEQVGIYGQAYRILDAASQFAFLFSVLLLPMFAKMIKKKQNIESLSQLSFLMIIIPAIIIVNICIFFNYDIMSLMYIEHFEESSKILSILMIGFLGVSTSYIFGTLLTSNGNLKYLNIMATFGMIINIVLNLILIPKYQAMGAAYSSMITQLSTALTQVIIAKKIFKFKTNYKLLILIFTFIIISIGTTYILSLQSFKWYYSVVIALMINLSISFAIRLLNLKNIFLMGKRY